VVIIILDGHHQQRIPFWDLDWVYVEKAEEIGQSHLSAEVIDEDIRLSQVSIQP